MYTKLLLFVLSSTLVHAQPPDSVVTLADAERQAVNESFGIRSQEEALDAAKWGFWDALLGYAPPINGSAQYIRLGNYTQPFTQSIPGTTPGGGPGTFMASLTQDTSAPPPQQPSGPVPEIPDDILIYDITISQPITNGGREIFAIQLAQQARQAASLQFRAQRQQAILDTRQSYFGAAAAEARLKVAQSSLAWAGRNRELSEIRVDNGVAPITNLLRWKAQVAQYEAQRAQAHAALERARLQLLTTMGFDLDKSIPRVSLQDIEYFSGQCTTLSVPLEDNVEIDNNPSVQAIDASTRLALYRKRLTLSQYLPGLNGFFSLQWQAADQFAPDTDPSWYLGLNLAVPLSGFTGIPAYRQASAEYRRQQVDYQQSRNGFIAAARAARLQFRAAREQVTAARRQLEFSEQTLETMQERFEAGVAGQSELLDVSLERDQANLRYIRAVFDCLTAYAQYQQSIGSLDIWGQHDMRSAQ